MKDFIVNILKGVCYLVLYLAAQTIGSYAVLFGTALRTALANPEMMETEAGIYDLMVEIWDAAVTRSGLILLIAAAVALIVLIVFFRVRDKRLWREAWLLPVRPLSLWPVIPAGAALAVVVGYAITWIPWPQSVLSAYEETYALTEGSGVLAVAATIFIAPFLEELIFRGLVFTRFCRGMPAPAAVILAATFFGALHGTILWAAYAFVGGIAMTLVFMKYRSILASMLLHASFNLFGGYLLGYLNFPSPMWDIALFALGLAALAALSLAMYRMPRRSIDVPLRAPGDGV